MTNPVLLRLILVVSIAAIVVAVYLAFKSTLEVSYFKKFLLSLTTVIIMSTFSFVVFILIVRVVEWIVKA